MNNGLRPMQPLEIDRLLVPPDTTYKPLITGSLGSSLIFFSFFNFSCSGQN